MLRRSKSAEGSDARVVRNTIMNASGSLIAVAVALFLTPLLIHRLGAAGYGVWTIATTLTFGLGYLSFADLGFEDAAARYIAEARGEGDMRKMNELFSTTFAMLVAVALVLTPILLVVASPLVHLFAIPRHLQGAAVVAFQFVLAQLLFELPNRAFAALVDGSQRAGLWQVVRLVQTLLLSGLMAAVVLLDKGIDWLGRATFGGTVVVFLVAAVIALRGVPGARLSPRYVSRSALKTLGRFSGQVFALRLISSIYRQIDKTVIGILLTASLVTTYEIGNKLYTMAALVQTLATMALVPAVAFNRRNLPLLQDMLIRGTSYTLSLAMPFTVAGMIFAAPLIRTWIGTGHGGSTLPAQLLLATLIPSFVIVVGQSMLTGIGRIMPMLWMVSAWTALNVGLSFALVKPLGVNGVVIATLIATVLLVLPLSRLFLREFDVGVGRFVRGALWPAVPAAAAQVAVGLALLPIARQTSSLPVVALLGGVSILASLSGYLFLGLRARERGYLLGTVRRTIGLEEAPPPAATGPPAPVPSAASTGPAEE